MKVPSYDDLAPSIPNISFKDGSAQVARLLPPPSRPATPFGGLETGVGQCHFACLRSTRAPQAILTIARDFSPRIERHGASCLVLDVSGLGRLIGDAHAIGAELEREAIARGGGIRVAVGPTQSSVRLLTLAHPGLTIAAGTAAESVKTVPIAILGQLLDESVPRLADVRSGDRKSTRLNSSHRL